MQTRLLLGVLALGMPEEHHDRGSQETIIAPKVLFWSDVESASKLHVGMLTISLIACLGFGGYMGFAYWTGKNALLCHVRNLTIAFFCRIFFSILFDGVVILGSNASVGGANTLLALECITQNLVFAFWLLLTVYLHAQLQRKFNSEPTLNLYEYAIPGVAVFFAFVWIFVLQAEFPSLVWWGFISALPQWIVGSSRLLYLLVQLGLVVDMGRMALKMSVDNDSLSLLRKSGGVLLALVFLFWLQFGLSLGRLSRNSTAAYLHFDYFVDGSQGALVCLGLFFLQVWVSSVSDSVRSAVAEGEGTLEPTGEGLPTAGRESVTAVELFMKKESRRWKESEEESKDVVYSSVVEPERLKKTLDLYRRLNVLPRGEVTVVGGEEFFDCGVRDSMTSGAGEREKWDFHSVISDSARTPPAAPRKLKTGNELIQKKNAFYASKYLIVEPKGGEFSKELDTTPSAHSPQKDRKGLFSLDTLMSDDLVKKWLNDHPGNVQGAKKPKSEQPTEKLSDRPAQDKPSERTAEQTQDERPLTGDSSPTQIIKETKVLYDFQSEFIRRPDTDEASHRGGTAEPNAVAEAGPSSGEPAPRETEKSDFEEGKPETPQQRGAAGGAPVEHPSETADQRKDSHSSETHSQLPRLSDVISSTFSSLFNIGLFRQSDGAPEVSAAADDNHETTVSRTEIESDSEMAESEAQIYRGTKAPEIHYSDGDVKPLEKYSKVTKLQEKYSEEGKRVPEMQNPVEGNKAVEKHPQVPKPVEKYSDEDAQVPAGYSSDEDTTPVEKYFPGHTKPRDKYTQEDMKALEKYSQDNEVAEMYYSDEDTTALERHSQEDMKALEEYPKEDAEVAEMYYSDEDTTALERHSKEDIKALEKLLLGNEKGKKFEKHSQEDIEALKKLLFGDTKEAGRHPEEAAVARESEGEAPETPEAQVAVSIVAVPVADSESAQNWSSDSNFSVEMETSSESSFSLDKYYAGLKSVRARVDESHHPYARPAKRAKLRD